MSTMRYTSTAITLHWLIAILIFIAFPIGVTVSNMTFSPLTAQLISVHKWIGITVFVLAVFRIIWRFTHPAPLLPNKIRYWEKALSKITHALLYILIFAIPLSGWLMSSAHGYQTIYLGLFPLPDLVSKNEILGERLEVMHSTLNWIILSLVSLHILGALKHHFIDHNDILKRMLPTCPSKTNQSQRSHCKK